MWSPDASIPCHDRAYMLGDAKRNDILTLSEVRRYGSDSFSDPDYVTLYGLKPADWYARGVRLLARTAVECTRDALADRIGRDVAAAAGDAPSVRGSILVDPFAGSANTLYWLASHAHPRRTAGFELDARVFETTRRNLTILGIDAELLQAGHEAGLGDLRVGENELLIVFVAPPWGDALDEASGLDLRRTQPPVPAIVDLLARTFSHRKVLLAVQVHESALRDSIIDVSSRCLWSTLVVYDINARGQNHGILLGSLGWSP